MTGAPSENAERRSRFPIYFGGVLFAGLMLLWLSSFFQNAWLLATGEGYVIPAESTVFTFQATVMNEGSGDWWVYGQDARNYYRFTGAGERPYEVYPRNRVAECSGFDPRDGSTWCD